MMRLIQAIGDSGGLSGWIASLTLAFSATGTTRVCARSTDAWVGRHGAGPRRSLGIPPGEADPS